MTDVSAFLYESFPAASFGGNIAGVVLLEHPASQSWMQGVAADLGAPTTGFVDLPSARQGCAEVRFFTRNKRSTLAGTSRSPLPPHLQRQARGNQAKPPCRRPAARTSCPARDEVGAGLHPDRGMPEPAQ